MESPNLLNNDLQQDGTGNGWYPWFPMPSLAPEFRAAQPDGTSLGVFGAGNRYCFGAWCQRVPVQPGQTYRLKLKVRCTGIDDLGLHLTPHIVWRRGDLPEEHCAEDAMPCYHHEGSHLIGDGLFTAPGNCDAAEVRLLVRYAPDAQVWFDQVSLTTASRQPSRMVRVGTMRFRPGGATTVEEHIQAHAEQIDRLGVTKPDIVLLPEFSNISALPQARGEELWQLAEQVPGPFCEMLSERARTHNTYVCAGIVEREGDFIFNAGVLYDRKGELVGKQRKIHPYWPEEPLGILPGDRFEVFQTDFGVVGIMICYDSWWPESARVLALKGAEMILFPNAGYEERILPARAIDNNVYVVAATLNSPAAIVNTRGELLAVTTVNNVLTADIDLNHRPKCHPNAGGNLNPGPGGARWARNAISDSIYEEILAEVKQSVLPNK